MPASTASQFRPAVPSVNYLRLKSAQANKLGERSEGQISYVVLASPDRSALFVALTGNDGGGYFSREVIDVQTIEDTLAGVASPFPVKVLRSALTGRSSNNPPFLMSLLRAEGLVEAAANKKFHYQLAGDWPAWRARMLALDGEPVQIPPPAPGSELVPATVPIAVEVAPTKAGRKARPKRGDIAASEAGGDDADQP